MDRLKQFERWAASLDAMSGKAVNRREALASGLRFALGAWTSLTVVGALAGCVRAPGTARDQMIFFSEEKEIDLGVRAYREVLRGSRLNENPEINEMVNRVGRRIAAAANKPEYHWEFAVIQDDRTINAFALPGGKVAIFTGLLPITKNEAGLATVVGHEVAHALQRHGAERMSRGILEQIATLGGMAGAVAGAVDPQAVMAAQSAYGVAASLPFNRAQETEADYIGLKLMAKAGYDPREAVPFWERMSGCPRNMLGRLCFRSQTSIPEFLSTHPSDISRINQLEAALPEAMRLYQPGGGGSPSSPSGPSAPYRPLIGPMPQNG
jgi:predicted Zn-dependent protease